MPCGAQALIRRKVKAVDKDALAHIKVPLPLPLAWGRTVAPYAPPGERAPAGPAPPCCDENVDANADPAARDAQTKAMSIVARDVLAADWGSLKTRFQARSHSLICGPIIVGVDGDGNAITTYFCRSPGCGSTNK